MERIVSRLKAILNIAGVHLIDAMPKNRLPRLEAPMVALKTEATVLKPFAHNRYLGESAGMPYYGDLAQTSIALDIYSPYQAGGQACTAAAKDILDAVSTGLGDFNLTSIQVSPVSYDAKADCFRSGLTLHLQGYRYWLHDN